MPYTHTNRRGVAYYLHEVTKRSGKTGPAMKRSVGEGALDEVPEGHEVVENVNGQVSVRKIPKRVLSELEEMAASGALSKHGREKYRVEVKGKRIVFFEPRTDVDECVSNFSRLGIVPPVSVRERLERRMRYLPVLRFTLTDRKKRGFDVERMCYLGSVDGWLEIAHEMPLARALDEFVPHLGEESFFELW